MKLKFNKVGASSLQLPALGFGGAPLGGLFSPVESEDSTHLLHQAWDNNLRYFDTAPFYGFGLSERLIGDHIRGLDYLLSTKVGRLLKPGALPDPAAIGWPDALPFHLEYDYSYDGIMRSYEDSLQRLGVDRIDALLVHDIGELTHGVEENSRHVAALTSGGYRALDELRRAGSIKAIGIGVNEIKMCLDALDIGDWDMFLLAGRYTLLEQFALDELLPRCQETNTSIIVGGPFNSGILVGGSTWNYEAAPAEIVERVDALKTCALEHQVPLAAAALQFPLAHPSVMSVIPGLRSPSELEQTLEWVKMDISVDFWSDLQRRELLHFAAPVPTTNPYIKR